MLTCMFAVCMFCLMSTYIHLAKVPGSRPGSSRQRRKHPGPGAHQHHQPVPSTRGSLKTDRRSDSRGEGKDKHSQIHRLLVIFAQILANMANSFLNFFDFNIFDFKQFTFYQLSI